LQTRCVAQLLTLLILLSTFLAACSTKPPIQVQLTHFPLPSQQQRISKPIVMQKLANDRRENVDRIGHRTLTVLFVEDRTAKLNQSMGEAIAAQVKEALESAGYQVSFEDSQKPSSTRSSRLMVDVKEFYFKSHSALWPIVPLSGDIVLELKFENPEGKIVYDQTFEASGSSFHPAHDEGFDIAIKEAMTKVLNKIVTASLSEDFQKAMR
jgi:uncharacterized lipoprotein YajG